MKTTIPFLDSVARAYLSRGEDLKDICFLFPNKRAGTFFLKALSDNLEGDTVLAPETLSVSDFMERLSGRETSSRIDMLFRLYNVYRKRLGVSPDLQSDKGILDFDRFAPWAETLLGDFNEVDQYGADAGALFKNVRDYDSIASNFLNEEQLETMERYFGYRPSHSDLDSFWRTLLPEEDRSELQLKFMELWKLMPELYRDLRADLEKDGLAMPGSTFRIACDRVLELGREALPWRKVVVVGFNMLSKTEAVLFEEMQKFRDENGEPYAEFFWDATGPVLAGGDRRSLASDAIRRNIRNFPMPGWARQFIDASHKTDMPQQISIAASPSNSAQVKVAMMQVEEWIEKYGMEAVQSPGTAIVLPDENMLLPLIHSLPPELEHVNLTMGYSMRYTSVASFVYHLRRLQSRRRRTAEGTGFYHEDLGIFLSHPLVQLVVGTETVHKIIGETQRNHIRIAEMDWLEGKSEVLARMLRPLAGISATETIEYIYSVLTLLDNALAADRKGSGVVNTKMERAQIVHYQQALRQLEDSIVGNGIEMRPAGVFHMTERLLAGETVNFEGEPLKGLQIMGVLETRALDFDRLIILSMNDSSMPRRSRRRTYIPEALRRGYGLPSAQRGEELSAYYFYRLLSRAKDVTLVYDARAGEGIRSGGKSRFLMQLEMLYARDSVREKVYTFGLSQPGSTLHEVVKTEAVMRRLEKFMNGKEGHLSASALMNYCECPVKFYYKNVVKLNDDSPAGKHVDAITQGNILHEVMLNLYIPDPAERHVYLEKRIVLTAGYIEGLMKDAERFRREVVRAVNKHHYHLPPEQCDRPVEGSVGMVLPRFVQQVRNVLANDLAHARNEKLELIGGEINGLKLLKVKNAPAVYFKYAFDRVDVCNGRMRILDYKTGKTNVVAETVDDLLGGAYETKYLPQLLLYALLLEEHVPDRDKGMAREVELMLIDANAGEEGVAEVRPSVGGVTVTNFSQIKDAFEEALERVLCEIFDPETPFLPAGEGKTCDFCRFKYLCGKE